MSRRCVLCGSSYSEVADQFIVLQWIGTPAVNICKACMPTVMDTWLEALRLKMEELDYHHPERVDEIRADLKEEADASNEAFRRNPHRGTDPGQDASDAKVGAELMKHRDIPREWIKTKNHDEGERLK